MIGVTVRIGELAQQTGASVRSLRYYEEQGLLHARRTGGDQRTYGTDAPARVRLLRQFYSAGLSSSTIASLLPCVDAPSREITRRTVDLMDREFARISGQIAELIATRDELSHLIDAAAAFHRDQMANDTEPPIGVARG